ncbi:MAG: MoaD/ThiS family protein [Candidatus Thorarchaeota archaeon]
MAEVFVKLLNRGLRSEDYEPFPIAIDENFTLGNLVDHLHETFGEAFEVFLEHSENRTLRRDAIVLVNGSNMVSKDELDTKLSDGDLIVFMIAAVGG